MNVSREYDELIGTTIDGKYRLDRCIGSGGMGSVYEALHLAIDKRVALKFLEPSALRDQDAVLRFQREARAASAVESAHIVQIFDSGVTERGRPYLVMELLRGEDLRARLRRSGRLTAGDAVLVARQVLRALSRAHRADIVHRDLKPENVFLCERDDEVAFVKIVDFGVSKIARRAEPELVTTKGTVLGTVFYMSPEQAQGLPDVDGRADLYSVGAILFECLTGRPPHDGPSYESVLVSICTEDAADVRSVSPDVPASLAAVVARALSRDRNARFQSADAFIEELDGTIATGPGADARSVLPPERRRHLPWVIAIVAALGAFALTAFALRARPPAAPEPPAPSKTQPVSETAVATEITAASHPPHAASVTPAAPSAAKPPTARKPKPTPSIARPLPSARPAPRKDRSGVAGGLELNLNEP